ncbi:MAG: HIT family protein, partial [Dehalococcoidia bacterium]
DEVPEEIAGRMTAVSSRISSALKEAVRMDGYNLFVANGEEAGQEVFHVHLHVIPRYRGDGFGFRFPEGYGRIEGREKLDELAEKLRQSV